MLLELYVTQVSESLLCFISWIPCLTWLPSPSQVRWADPLWEDAHFCSLCQGKAADLDNGNFNHNRMAYFKHKSRCGVTDASLKGRKDPWAAKNRHRIMNRHRNGHTICTRENPLRSCTANAQWEHNKNFVSQILEDGFHGFKECKQVRF